MTPLGSAESGIFVFIVWDRCETDPPVVEISTNHRRSHARHCGATSAANSA